MMSLVVVKIMLHCSAMDDHDEMQLLKNWLPKQSPRTWHQVALTWNWDSGLEILDWILDQPYCDRGTAIAVYLLGEPSYYAEKFRSIEEMYEKQHFGLRDAEFLARVCRRWSDGWFSTYRFHPGNWSDRSRLWEEVPPGKISKIAPWPVPDSMAASPLKGEAVDLSGFSEGMPNTWVEDVDQYDSLIKRAIAMISGKRS